VRFEHGIAILIRYALQNAVMHLAKVAVEYDIQVMPGGDYLGSTGCPREVAGVDTR